MALWLVRAGKHGEQEPGALEKNVISIGWNEFGDLSGIKSKKELTKLYLEKHPNFKKMRVANEVGQIWRFIHEIQIGDLVALPLKLQSGVAIGKVESDYKYEKIAPNIKHIRYVKWIKIIPRSAFDQDILYSLGAFMTVCKIERNNAENRVKKLLKGEIPREETKSGGTNKPDDVERYAKDLIIKYIDANFKGHGLVRLVNAILKAQGYITKQSPQGPDGGVDILAAAGPLGFDKPRVCVQVKSSSSPVDVKVVRELQGVMSKLKADHGLLVSWGGFTTVAWKEAKDTFFSIRLWDQDDLLQEIFRYYELFDDELKTDLPLKRIWILIPEEDKDIE